MTRNRIAESNRPIFSVALSYEGSLIDAPIINNNNKKFKLIVKQKKTYHEINLI